MYYTSANESNKRMRVYRRTNGSKLAYPRVEKQFILHIYCCNGMNNREQDIRNVY